MPPAEATVIQMIYVSAATGPFSTAQLEALLQTSRDNNEAVGVSGMLLHDDGTFLQVLEGPEDEVESLYERIGRDTRHTDSVVLWKREIEQRAFGQWRMGFVDGSGGALEKVPGYCPFFRPSYYLETDDPDGSKAFDVLCRFRDGAFRRSA